LVEVVAFERPDHDKGMLVVTTRSASVEEAVVCISLTAWRDVRSSGRLAIPRGGVVPIANGESSESWAIIGLGLRAVWRGEMVYVGQPELFDKMGYLLGDRGYPRLREEGKTVILVGAGRDYGSWLS
jgi:hypothetical protein